MLPSSSLLRRVWREEEGDEEENERSSSRTVVCRAKSLEGVRVRLREVRVVIVVVDGVEGFEGGADEFAVAVLLLVGWEIA